MGGQRRVQGRRPRLGRAGDDEVRQPLSRHLRSPLPLCYINSVGMVDISRDRHRPHRRSAAGLAPARRSEEDGLGELSLTRTTSASRLPVRPSRGTAAPPRVHISSPPFLFEPPPPPPAPPGYPPAPTGPAALAAALAAASD